MLMELRERKEKRFGRIGIDEAVSLRRLNTILNGISSRQDIGSEKLMSIINKRVEYDTIPAEIFNNALSPLENVVLYMHIKLGMSQSKIAVFLRRDHTTIWTTLENALAKTGKREYLAVVEGDLKGEITVPLALFSNRNLSILENLSIYIKGRFDMSYHEIAVLLGKNDRTIWTVVNRAKKKQKYHSIVNNRNL